MGLSSLLLAPRLARREMRRREARQRYPDIEQAKLPVLFANSFPKSGTHLLTQILNGFAQLAPFTLSGMQAIRSFEGHSGRQRAPEQVAHEIKRLKPGDIAYGHVLAYPETIPLLTSEGFASFFIYRDPRDVLVSHVHYVTEINPNHVHHGHYQTLKDFDARLATSIRGIPNARNPFPDIRERFNAYLPWLPLEAIHKLRFEELVEKTQDTVTAMLAFVESRDFQWQGDRQPAVQTLMQGIDPKKSPTFRSGKTGAWRAAFKPHHKQLFKSLAGDLLIDLGYEKDHDW